MKRILMLLMLVLCLLFFGVQAAWALDIEAAAAILIDAGSGRVLFEQDARTRLPVASVTKILTALVVLEHFNDLQQTFTLPEDYVNVGEAGIYLEAGETHTIEDLLYALMLPSANDAAQALALATAGSEQAFAQMMNARCAALGLRDSNWTNPHGLHHNEHLTTAYDVAFITREALKIPKFNSIIVTASHTLPWPGKENDRVISGHNRLLLQYEGADGVKTGYTSKAGQCLVGSATRNGIRLIGVILNSEERYEQMAVLLDYGFDNYEMRQVISFGEVAAKLPVIDAKEDNVSILYGGNVRLFMRKGLEYQPQPIIELPASLQTPVYRDEPAGRALFDDGMGNMTVVDLYPAADMEYYTFWSVVRIAYQRILQVLLIK